jgi:hypothetical protein
MASFLNTAEIDAYHQAINDHFDTFKRQIIVHKEPIKKVIQNTTNQILGYQEDSNIVDYEYIPRNNTFDAIIKYTDSTDNLAIDPEVRLKFPDQLVEIKVKKDTKNYIDTDRTEKITFDEKTFNIVSTSVVKNYHGLIYYVYYLKETF